jgi:hypothetical protein
LPPIADINRRIVDVRFVPKADIRLMLRPKEKPPDIARGFVERRANCQWN